MMLSSPPGRWIIKNNKIVPLDGTSKDIAVDTNVFYIDRTNGRIGIGTTTPGYALEVVGAITTWGGTGPGFRMFNVGSTESGVYEDFRIISSANVYHIQSLAGGGGTGRDININNGVNPFLFLQYSTGRVNIGATSPQLPLQVNGLRNPPATSGTAQNGILVLQGDGSGMMNMGVVAGGGGWIQVSDAANLATTYKMMLNPNGGNVGINTTNPMNILDIARKIAISGDGHILAGTDVAGQITISAGGSAAVKNFTTAYSVAPYVQLTALSDLGKGVLGSNSWVESAAGSFVANVNPVGGAVTFNYFVIGSMV